MSEIQVYSNNTGQRLKNFDNIIMGGRLANYQYYDMDQVFHAALVAVDKEFGK